MRMLIKVSVTKKPPLVCSVTLTVSRYMRAVRTLIVLDTPRE